MVSKNEENEKAFARRGIGLAVVSGFCLILGAVFESREFLYGTFIFGTGALICMFAAIDFYRRGKKHEI